MDKSDAFFYRPFVQVDKSDAEYFLEIWSVILMFLFLHCQAKRKQALQGSNLTGIV
jgi:hypothetical protein